MSKLFISGCGSYLPENSLLNSQLPKHLETSDEWIKTRTGIEKRHIAGANESTSHMAVKALERALASARITAEKLDGIIVATCTGDMFMPSTANIVQNKINACSHIPALDVQAACSGFVYALNISESLLRSNIAMRNIAVIGAEKMSALLDWNDRSTCVLFGDGAGAVILSKTDDSFISSNIMDRIWYTKLGLTEILKTEGGVSSNERGGFLKMNGQEVFKHAVREMSYIIKTLAERNGLNLSDIKKVIPHQANKRIFTAIAKNLNIDEDIIVSTVDEHANTSSASIPLALDSVHKDIKRGDIVILVSAGAGMTFGGVLLRY